MNIFENAKFGDKFRTRDGRMAIFAIDIRMVKYASGFGDLENPFLLIIDGEATAIRYYSNGKLYKSDKFKVEIDIISKWEEPVDEEELTQLSIDSVKKSLFSNPNRSDFTAYMCGFAAGYRKAKE